MVDVAVHGVGLTSLQFRDAAGANTHEVESNISAPKTVRIEKRGDLFLRLRLRQRRQAAARRRIHQAALTGDFYIGIGVCSHDKDVVEKAVFSNVSSSSFRRATGKHVLVSSLETISIASTDRHVEYVAAAHFEAPNWSRDGNSSSSTRTANPAPPGLRRQRAHVIPTGRRSIATTITASRPTASRSPSATQLHRRPQIARLHCAHRRRNSAPHHAQCAVLLARLVARRQDAGLHRPARTATSTSTPSPQPAAKRRA
jgi:hypothetical protein